MADPRQLAALSFFHGMPERTLNRIAQSATELSVPAGHVLVRQNDRATAVFFLLSGSVQILIRVGSDDLLVGVLREEGGSSSGGRRSARPTATPRRCAVKDLPSCCAYRRRSSTSCSSRIRHSLMRPSAVLLSAWRTGTRMPVISCTYHLVRGRSTGACHEPTRATGTGELTLL
jgi:hypothetical protein